MCGGRVGEGGCSRDGISTGRERNRAKPQTSPADLQDSRRTHRTSPTPLHSVTLTGQRAGSQNVNKSVSRKGLHHNGDSPGAKRESQSRQEPRTETRGQTCFPRDPGLMEQTLGSGPGDRDLCPPLRTYWDSCHSPTEASTSTRALKSTICSLTPLGIVKAMETSSHCPNLCSGSRPPCSTKECSQ